MLLTQALASTKIGSNMASPNISPNWAKRMMRLNTPKSPKGVDMNDPSQVAAGMFNAGLRAGPDGRSVGSKDWGGLLTKASQGINSLSRGVRGGQFSGLGQPLNSGREQNPGFFNSGGSAGGVEGFSQMLSQTREQRIAQAQKDGTFDTIRDKFNQDNSASGSKMNKFGNIMAGPIQGRVPMRSGLMPQAGPDPSIANRQALEQGAAGIKLQREASGESPTITSSGGVRSISGKYGSGMATNTPTTEGLIGGRPFSEVMQGLANKPGIAREGDTFQPQTGGNALYAKTSGAPVKSASDLLKSAPKKLPFTTIPDKKGKQMLASVVKKKGMTPRKMPSPESYSMEGARFPMKANDDDRREQSFFKDVQQKDLTQDQLSKLIRRVDNGISSSGSPFDKGNRASKSKQDAEYYKRYKAGEWQKSSSKA